MTLYLRPKGQVRLALGDITRQRVDAIVNAANARLAGGGGVDGAIHHAAGPELMRRTRRDYPNGCPTGSAVITEAGNLPCSHVIHAVGPFWDGGGAGEPDLLRSAYRESFQLADRHRCRIVAVPAISCGVYGYPLQLAAPLALATASHALEESDVLEEIRFVLFSERVFAAFREAAEQLEWQPDGANRGSA